MTFHLNAGTNMRLCWRNVLGIHSPTSQIALYYLATCYHYIGKTNLYHVRRYIQGIYYIYNHSVHPPSFLQGGLSLLPNFQKGGLKKTSTFRGGKEGGYFFQGGLQFSHEK